MLEENGSNYEILSEAAKSVDWVKGLTVEIGLRAGGGTKRIIDGLLESKALGRTHIAIDPYGQIDYLFKDGATVTYDYTNEMRNNTLSQLYEYIKGKPINFYLYPMEDFEFFRRFADGVPVYDHKRKSLVNEYALVYFDGPHTTETTLAETRFFAPRASPGAIYVYDDVEGFYDHSVIKQFHLNTGWKVWKESPTKIAYMKL